MKGNSVPYLCRFVNGKAFPAWFLSSSPLRHDVDQATRDADDFADGFALEGGLNRLLLDRFVSRERDFHELGLVAHLRQYHRDGCA